MLFIARFEDDQQLNKQAAMANMDEDTTRERSATFVWTPKLRCGTRYFRLMSFVVLFCFLFFVFCCFLLFLGVFWGGGC